MLCVDTYPKDSVDACRSRMEAQLAVYRVLVTTAREKAGTGKSAFDLAVGSFEPLFFSNLVLVLDNSFVHPTHQMPGLGCGLN
jgi:hypothetical protein